MHYYDLEGNPRHEVVGANGKIRPTTIADARKLKLVPSVTTVLDLQAKPALLNWIMGQVMDAAIEKPFHPDEWEIEKYKDFLSNSSRRVAREAAQLGNNIHDSMELYFKEGAYDHNRFYTEKAIDLILTTFPEHKFIAEESFANLNHGFGGCVDLHSNDIIIDFKTKDKEDIYKVKPYDDYKMQLAAYRLGLEMPKSTRLFNLFISTSPATAGDCSIVEITDCDHYENLFIKLLNFWQAKNKHNVGAL